MANHVKQLMTPDPIMLEVTDSVRDAATRMRDEHVGAILVELHGTLRGLVSDRDLVVRVLAEGRDPGGLTVGEIVSEEVAVVAPDDTLDAAMAVMREHGVQRVPVVEDGTAIGILSVHDLAVDRGLSSLVDDIVRGQSGT